MIRDGELPEGQLCVISGVPTTDSLDLYVQCESTWIKGPGQGRYVLVVLMILFLPFWIIWFLVGKALLDEERRELGHNRGVSVPLRVSQQCHEQLRRSSQSHIKKLLRTVPVYAQLLNEFPKARVRV